MAFFATIAAPLSSSKNSLFRIEREGDVGALAATRSLSGK
jgi:hypothetical protein